MSTTVSLQASPRTEVGKGETKRLRRTGKIPAIAYGKGLAATPISVPPDSVMSILRSERGKNTVISLDVGAKKISVMIRDYSVHPVARSLEHVDFVEVKLDQPVDVDVPLITTGKAQGVTLGGVLRQVFRTLPVRCLPTAVPVKIEVDVTPLKLSEHIATQDLKLDAGVTVRLPATQTLVAVVAPEKEKPEETAATAAPAAGAAAPAAAAGAKDAKAAEPAKDAKKK